MRDLTDPTVAREALADATTDATELRLIAQNHPDLRAQVAMHPAAYAGLLDWLESLGDPLLSAVVNVRRNATEAPHRPLPVEGERSTSGPAQAPSLVGAAPKRRRSRLLLGLGSGVLALGLVVTGIATRGFGLLPSGGSATPEEEALKVANKTVELVNSFSVSNLLSNPLTAMGSLTSECAPSEARLTSALTTVDTTDLMGLTGDTISLLADIAGSFKVATSGLETETSMLTDDIAVVSFVRGTVTATADTARLRTALPKVPGTVSAQLVATAEKYGLHPKVNLDDQFPVDWVDDTMDAVEERFPMTVDLAEIHDWNAAAPSGSGESPGGENPLVMVRDGGRWYLSTMLTSVFVNGTMAPAFSADNPTAERSRAELKRLVEDEPSRNDSPIAAAEGMADALARADERAILKQLPLAERRLAALTRVLSAVESGGEVSVDYQFSELARNGQQARLRIDEFSVDGTPDFAIEDGSCVVTAAESYCLKDALDSKSVERGLNYVRDYLDDYGQYQIQAFEDTTGLDLYEVLDKLEVAAEVTVETVDPDQLGIVAVEEEGGWFVSVTATLSDFQNQAGKALVAGLKAAQKG